jgi:Helix-turn-helix domain
MTQQHTTTAAPNGTAFRILDAKWDGRSTFKVPEVAKILGISEWAAWEAVNRGDIPTVRIGRRCIVPRIAVERLLSAA